MITAMVIFLIAVADVKGFALMLLIGTVISLLTAVAATRALLGLLSGFKWFDNPRFMGAEGQQTAKWLQIDFIGAPQLVVRALRRDHPRRRHRARGQRTQPRHRLQGRHADHVLDAEADVDEHRLPDHDAGGAARRRCSGQGQARQRRRATRSSRSGLEDARAQKELTKLQAPSRVSSARTAAARRTSPAPSGTRSPSTRSWGIIVSLLLITIYITIRFDLKFAIPVILAMLHDILITIGVYALVGKEVSVATVAAVLTVLGYSIYDTIIIFDRIRENIPLMRRSPFATIANISLWETVRRSLATTFITLLPIICLMIFGGAILRDFAFALIVGVTSGAYSSIFIAAPILVMWKEREPEYARRKAAAAAESDTAALRESEAALAAEPTPHLVGAGAGTAAVAAPAPVVDDAREKRRQRRRSRPHGRTR